MNINDQIGIVAVQLVDANGVPQSGETVALAAGTALIGKVGIDQTTPGTTNAVAVTAGTALIGKVGIDQTTPGTTNAVAPISGQAGVAAGAGAVSATVQRVTLASDDPAVSRLTGPSTGTQSNVASSASAVTVLAANSARKGVAIYNESTAILYLILSNTTPTSSVYTVQIGPGGYYELPLCQGGPYTGIIKGIWASANGNARVTELT